MLGRTWARTAEALGIAMFLSACPASDLQAQVAPPPPVESPTAAADFDLVVPTGRTPALGTVAWAIALRDARRAVEESPKEPKAILAAYGDLLALYGDCPACRYIYESIARDLGKARAPYELVARMRLRAEDRSDPVAYAKALASSKQPDEARRVAEEWLDKVPLVDQRCELMLLLANLLATSDPKRSADLFRRRLDLVAAGGDYYKQLAEYLVRTGKAPELPMENIDNAVDWKAAIDVLRSWQRKYPGDTNVACVFNDILGNLRGEIRAAEQAHVPVSPEIPGLFPQGILAAQRELAAWVKDPRMRAAILLNAASTIVQNYQNERAAVPELLRDAKAADSSVPIELAVLAMSGAFAPMSAEATAAGDEILRSFPNYQMACWISTERSRLHPPRTIPDLKSYLGSLGKGCDREGPNVYMLAGWQPGPERREGLEVLLAAGPRGRAAPEILMALADESSADPARADELEREAFVHPDFPALVMPGSPGFGSRAFAAEKRGNFQHALFHVLLTDAQHLCGTFPGFTEGCGRFIESYYRVRCNLDAEAQWKEMLSAVPSDPAAPFADMAHTTVNLDRLVAAAHVVHRERELAGWLRALQGRYEEADRAKPAVPDPTRRTVDDRRIALTIGGYILDLENSVGAPR